LRRVSSLTFSIMISPEGSSVYLSLIEIVRGCLHRFLLSGLRRRLAGSVSRNVMFVTCARVSISSLSVLRDFKKGTELERIPIVSFFVRQANLA